MPRKSNIEGGENKENPKHDRFNSMCSICSTNYSEESFRKTNRSSSRITSIVKNTHMTVPVRITLLENIQEGFFSFINCGTYKTKKVLDKEIYLDFNAPNIQITITKNKDGMSIDTTNSDRELLTQLRAITPKEKGIQYTSFQDKGEENLYK